MQVPDENNVVQKSCADGHVFQGMAFFGIRGRDDQDIRLKGHCQICRHDWHSLYFFLQFPFFQV